MINRIKLKGGSLSNTFLIEENSKKYVRKEVSISKNREYGFRRWYSQLKKLQRYSIQFPGLFPNILEYGIKDNYAYFDMEYIENSINAHEYLLKETSENKIRDFFNELITKMNFLHNIKIRSCKESMALYIREEVEQSINACNNERFLKFSLNDKIKFNNQEVYSFMSILEEYKDLSITTYNEEYETYSHGNLTLENMLYIPNENKIIFIDPYEENIIDSKLADYSQLLQSSNSKYEIINNLNYNIDGNQILFDLPSYKGIEHFNQLLSVFLKEGLNKQSYLTVKLLEISQFVRMLPFKQDVDPDKMIVFYGLASKLFNDINK
jgi:hypothetical protein